jgi:hypothetical protein
MIAATASVEAVVAVCLKVAHVIVNISYFKMVGNPRSEGVLSLCARIEIPEPHSGLELFGGL